MRFLSVILDRLTFDAKIAAVQDILKIKAGGKFEKTYGKLIKELRSVKEDRNRFAHHIVDVYYNRDEPIPKEFSLINFRTKVDSKVFSKGEYELLLKRIYRCREEINKVLV